MAGAHLAFVEQESRQAWKNNAKYAKHANKVCDTLEPEYRFLLHLLADRVLSGQLSQSQVAEATGVHQSQVSRILSGEARRASKNVLRLCKFAESLPSVGSRLPVDRKLAEMFAMHLGCLPEEEAAVAELIEALRRWRGTWGGNERPA